MRLGDGFPQPCVQARGEHTSVSDATSDRTGRGFVRLGLRPVSNSISCVYVSLAGAAEKKFRASCQPPFAVHQNRASPEPSEVHEPGTRRNERTRTRNPRRNIIEQSDWGCCRFRCGPSPIFSRYHLQRDIAGDVLRYKRHFRLFREMRKARDFRLVLCADVLDCMVEHAIQTLEHTLIAREVNGGLDYFIYKPLVISERRSSRTRPIDDDTGWSATSWPGLFSVL